MKLNFLEYLNGFSNDVIDIAKKLDLWHAVDRLTETDISKADSLKEERNRNFIRTFFDIGIAYNKIRTFDNHFLLFLYSEGKGTKKSGQRQISRS